MNDPKRALEAKRLAMALSARGCSADLAGKLPGAVWMLAASKARTRMPNEAMRQAVIAALRMASPASYRGLVAGR